MIPAPKGIDSAEAAGGRLGAVLAAPRGGLVQLGAPSVWLATTPELVKRVLAAPDDFDFPGDVTRSGDLSASRGDTRSGHLLFDPPDPAQVATGVTTFAAEWEAALEQHDRSAPGTPYDATLLLREPVGRATTAALLPHLTTDQRAEVADLVLTWIDALAPVIAARRPPHRWSRARRREAASRERLEASLAALLPAGGSAPMMATYLAAGIQVPIAAGAWLLAWAASCPEPSPDPAHVVWETLRLSPPTWITARVAVRDLALDDQQVREGSLVWVSPLLLGRDDDLVPGGSPAEFRPGRWSAAAPRPGAWLPFGAGPHACPGRNLGIAMLGDLAAWAGRHDLMLTRQVGYDQSRGIVPTSCLFTRREAVT